MKLHLFQSGKEPDVFGFTSNEMGHNLPTEFAPWVRCGQGGLITTETDDMLLKSGQLSLIFAAIQRDGFYIARSKSVINQRGTSTVN